MNIGQLIQSATVIKLTNDELYSFDAPYPNSLYKAGVHVFPSLVPTPDNPNYSNKEYYANIQAWNVLKKWNKPFITCFGDSDPVTRNSDKVLQKSIPGALKYKNKHSIIKDGGHFIQNDKPNELVNIIVDLIQTTKNNINAKL